MTDLHTTEPHVTYYDANLFLFPDHMTFYDFCEDLLKLVPPV
eukprot:CAMPEP_0197257384 /NCGR_PEP_ID=MMETSP1429-20130617/78529_1 /TAXON_ID=49237 /ORGANISM="Chaetoceros  sp., Strain UNC1202" /LENGTH=41 /DNA_ID= /DNA_START= /DNA_END= /DNA_ORIENTATION=